MLRTSESDGELEDGEYLFFECRYVHFLWQASSLHLFHSWSKMGGNKHNYLYWLVVLLFVGQFDDKEQNCF